MIFSVFYVVSMKDSISTHLTIGKSAKSLYEKDIFNIPLEDIRLDFTNVKTISKTFALQYLLSKHQSKKQIIEINVPSHVEQIIKIVQKSIDERERERKD